MAVNYKNLLDKFITNNVDLIGEYEAMSSAMPIEYCVNDIIALYNAVSKNNKTIDFNSTMKSALKYSIKNDIPLTDSLDGVLLEFSNNYPTYNSIQQYFKEINSIYKKNNDDFNIEYSEENREKIIEMNLKTVISIAKRYQGLGLSLGELISAGNLGLCVAFDKFDPSRSKLKDNVMSIISLYDDKIFYKDIFSEMKQYLEYGGLIDKFEEHFAGNEIISKKELKKWVNSNIFNAKFNSIATMWIRAYILIEIDNYSRVVKKPKSEIYKDKKSSGSYKRENIIEIDSPISESSQNPIINIFQIDTDETTDLETTEAYDTLKKGLNILLDGVKTRDRCIFLKKFGIGFPRPMLPKEIAEQEGLSIARISQIFQTVIEKMQQNQVKFNVDKNIMFDVVKKIL